MKHAGIVFFETSIMIAIVQQENAQWIVRKMLTLPFDENAQHNSLMQLKTLLKTVQHITLSLPAACTLSRNITLDASLSDTEILQYLVTQCETLFGSPSHQLCMDYVVNRTANQKHITAIAAHRQDIQHYQNQFAKANLTLNAIITESIATFAFESQKPRLMESQKLTEFMLSIGAALATHTINLLPWRERQQLKQRNYFLVRVVSYAVFSLCLLFMMPTWISAHTRSLSIKINQLMAKIQTLQQPLDYQEKIHLLNQLKKIMREKTQSDNVNHHLQQQLIAIARALPATATLRQLDEQPNAMTLSGYADQSATVQTYFAALQLALSHTQSIELMKLQENPSATYFKIKIT